MNGVQVMGSTVNPNVRKIPLSFDCQADDLELGAQTLQAIEQGRLDYEAGRLDRLEPNEALEALQALSHGMI